MKVGMLVEDRDTGYLFLDTTDLPEGAAEVVLTSDPAVHHEEWENEQVTAWVQDAENNLRVVPYDTVFGADGVPNIPENGPWPIPTPIIVLDRADYEARLAE